MELAGSDRPLGSGPPPGWSLEGKVAVVTGGAGGIGAATARLMVARGAGVAVADLNLDRAKELASELLAAGGQAIALPLDLADEESIKTMLGMTVGHFGKLDILHNNAAALDPDLGAADLDFAAIPTWAWDRIFTVNCRGSFIAIREALPHLLETGGCIVNTVSNLGLQGHMAQAAYSASKAALIQMTRSVAAGYGKQGLRCNAVAPGMTVTASLLAWCPPQILQAIEAETLRQGLGKPEEIAEVVAFLASPAASNINGEVLVADGGFSSHIPALGTLRALS